MIIPNFLKPGDKIALLAPARFMDLEQLQPFESWIIKNEWELVVSPNLGKRFHQFGGTENERLADIIWALENTEIKAVFSARGGYGTLRLFRELQKLDFGKYPKWWVGFSDLTILHAVLYQKALSSIHGPLAMQFAQQNPYLLNNQRSLEDALNGKFQQIPFENVVCSSQQNASFEGILWGGNLSMIYSLAAAGELPNLTGKVLFIEDIDEYIYHVDRMLRALEISGLFNGIQGLIVGSMTDMKDHEIPFGWSVSQIIDDVLENYNFPILYGIPCGHDQKNFSLKLGMSIKFDGETLFQF